MTKSLTARGVRAMLTRSGVDHAELTITEREVTARRVDIDFTGPWERYTEVIVTGPAEPRRAAWWALFDRGLSNAPYPDRDEWSRQ